MEKNEEILSIEYSKEFDEIRKRAVIVSYYKYGRSKVNFESGNVDAIGTIRRILDKFKETGNTLYLADVANYAMFRYMYPQGNEHFDPDGESAGKIGFSEKELMDE